MFTLPNSNMPAPQFGPGGGTAGVPMQGQPMQGTAIGQQAQQLQQQQPQPATTGQAQAAPPMTTPPQQQGTALTNAISRYPSPGLSSYMGTTNTGTQQVGPQVNGLAGRVGGVGNISLQGATPQFRRFTGMN